jgi:hypothetical protein
VQEDSLLVTFQFRSGGMEMPEGRRLVNGGGRDRQNPKIVRTLG